MLFSILLVVFLFAVTFFQAMHGFYSSLIMMVLTLCCAALAVGTFEWVALNWTVQLWPDYAYSLALAGAFALPLAVLRAVFDSLIRRSTLLPTWLERGGGGLCGLITGLIATGVLGLCITTLPWDRGSFLTFARIDYEEPDLVDPESNVNPEAKDPQIYHNLLFSPDRAMIALAGYLSDNLFSVPDANFRAEHPDVVKSLGWVNAVPMEMQRFAAPGSVSVVEGSTRKVDHVFHYTKDWAVSDQDKPVDPGSGNEFWAVRLKLSPQAKGKYPTHAFTPRQVRLVGRRRPGGDLEPVFPIALEGPDKQGRHMNAVKFRYGDWPVVDIAFSPAEPGEEIEVVYEIPKGFRAEYVEYKLGARADVSFVAGETPSSPSGASSGARPSGDAGGGQSADATQPSGGANPAPSTGGAPPSKDGTVPSVGQGGNVRAVTTRAGRSGFGDSAPFALKKYTTLKDTQIQGAVLKQGHLVGYADEQQSAPGEAVSVFEVPADKRLLQLNVMSMKAGSLYGKAMRFAVGTVQNYTVLDDRGQRTQFCGKAAASIVGDREVIEIQYFPEQVGSIGGVGAFQAIKESQLDKDDQLVLFFLVDPGVKIVEFSTGGQANRADDLRGEGLVAPQ